MVTGEYILEVRGRGLSHIPGVTQQGSARLHHAVGIVGNWKLVTRSSLELSS